MGRTGTSRDLTPVQATALLVSKEIVLAPVPVIEQQCKQLNMKQMICGIFQICTNDSEPITEPLPYCLLLNDLITITDWIITGEYNDDGVFHTHCLIKTGSRPDSAKRSIMTVWERLVTTHLFNTQFSPDCQMDVIKLQKCHKPESMLKYLMKSPSWVVSNTDKMLELAVSIEGWNLNERFRKPAEPDVSPDINQMSKELINVIMTGNCKSLDDMIRHDPNTLSKYLHRPGLSQIVNNCLTFVQATASMFSLAMFKEYSPRPDRIHQCLLHQGIEPSDFDKNFWKWVCKKELKINTLVLLGPSNTGKSAFISGFKQCVPWGEIVNSQNFQFEQLADASFGIHEEPLISPEQAEKYKQIMEGMPTSITVKYKKPIKIGRIPILMTTNHAPWRFCTAEEQMFRNRMFIYDFRYEARASAYLPRSSERRCECGYCRASRGGAPGDGSASAGGMSATEQSVSAGQQRDPRTESLTNVRSGPMRESERSVSASIPSASANQRAVDSGSASSSSSSATLGDRRHADRIIESGHSRNRGDSAGSSSEQHVESSEHRRHDDAHSGRTRETGASNRTGDGTIRRDSKQHDNVTKLLVLGKTKSSEKEISIPPKKSRLARKMGTALDMTLCIPSSQDWKHYLSYLLDEYGD